MFQVRLPLLYFPALKAPSDPRSSDAVCEFLLLQKHFQYFVRSHQRFIKVNVIKALQIVHELRTEHIPYTIHRRVLYIISYYCHVLYSVVDNVLLQKQKKSVMYSPTSVAPIARHSVRFI